MQCINACFVTVVAAVSITCLVGFCSLSRDMLALPAGAHMNAAVTFTSCALGRMAWKKFPVYVLGQFMGSFLAAATIYCLFYGECPPWVVRFWPPPQKCGKIQSQCPGL